MSPRPTPESAAFRHPECTELLELNMPKAKDISKSTARDFDNTCRAIQVELIRCHYKHMAEQDRARAAAMVVALENADSYPVPYPGPPLNQADCDAVRAAWRAMRRKARREAMEPAR